MSHSGTSATPPKFDSNLKIAVLGCGNLGSAIAKGIVASKLVQPSQIAITRRNLSHAGLEFFQAAGFQITADNNVAIKDATLVLVCVLPQYLNELLQQIKTNVTEKHIVVSCVSGAEIADIKRQLGNPEVEVIRAMPNTAIAVQESMTCIAGLNRASEKLALVTQVFDALGSTLIVEEKDIVPATALCACGIAFFCRAIRAAAQGGTEIGFHSEDAIHLAAQTAKGAAALLLVGGNHPEREIDKVTTPLGCTITGLNQMEHSGFSSAFIKGIVTAAEKAATLYKNKKRDD
eukprot:TRINITY_DN26649_c0_g1_i1.p1 TRINITY_DN26649_c0_g1~~TRINITY_DN26649_c0_g1_i1.p1  ORF type:complete len:290 (-),score=71.57 TRINITY_DN26649_c0_g1_i1:273-1142(-)